MRRWGLVPFVDSRRLLGPNSAKRMEKVLQESFAKPRTARPARSGSTRTASPIKQTALQQHLNCPDHRVHLCPQ